MKRSGRRSVGELLDAGHSLTIYDINETAMLPLLERQARRGASPRDLADRCEIVFVSLPTLAAFREVAFGADGLIHGAAMSGSDIDRGRVVWRIAAEYAYLDERGGVGIRLEPAAAIVWRYGEQFRRSPRQRQPRPAKSPLV